MSDLNLAIRGFVDALAVHNYDLAERWAALAFRLWSAALEEWTEGQFSKGER